VGNKSNPNFKPMTNKIDKKITLLWNNIRELYKTYGHLPRTSYWHKPYQMWLGQNLYAIKILKELK
jgi:hypothetical protein